MFRVEAWFLRDLYTLSRGDIAVPVWIRFIILESFVARPGGNSAHQHVLKFKLGHGTVGPFEMLIRYN